MNYSRRVLTVLSVVVFLGLIAGGIWWRLRPEGGGTEQVATTTADSLGVDLGVTGQQFSTDVPQPVEGAVVVRDTLWQSVRAAGRAEAIRRVVLRSQVEGLISTLPIRENSGVAGDQVVVQIDSTETALAMAQSRAELLNAEAQFQRLTLFADEIEDLAVRSRREEFAKVESGLAGAELALKQDSIQLAHTSVRTPFGGRVADLLVVEGQYIAAGTDLMTIVDLDPIKVEAEVLEAEIGLLSEGRRAVVSFAAFPGEEFEGSIQSINPVIDAQERTGRVTLLLRNPQGRIKPGMYADVSLEAQSYPDRILVPREAILERGDRRTMLFVYEEQQGRGLAKWRYVTTGEENETLIEVVPSDEGMVEVGETVLVDGHHYLAHDTSVRIVENVVVEGGRPGG